MHHESRILYIHHPSRGGGEWSAGRTGRRTGMATAPFEGPFARGHRSRRGRRLKGTRGRRRSAPAIHRRVYICINVSWGGRGGRRRGRGRGGRIGGEKRAGCRPVCVYICSMLMDMDMHITYQQWSFLAALFMYKCIHIRPSSQKWRVGAGPLFIPTCRCVYVWM